MEQIRDKRIRSFLSGLGDIEFRYVRLSIDAASQARKLVYDFKCSRERFCQELQINPEEYNCFMRGGYPYDLRTMARLQALYIKLSNQRSAEEAKDLIKMK